MTQAQKDEQTLGALAERITVGHVGPMADSYVRSGVPFLRSQDIHEFQISTTNIKFIPSEFDEKLRKSRLKAGDVAIVRTGYPGTAAVVPPELDGANCADLVIITPGAELDAWFVACLLNSAWGRGHISGVLVGVAQQHFNVGAARDLKTHFPPLAAQRRIGSIIKTYCDLIEVNQRRIAILEEMARRLFDEWFVRFRYPGHEAVPLTETELGIAPSGWSPRTLSWWADDVREVVSPAELDPASVYVGLEHLPRRSTTLVAFGRADAVMSSKLRFKEGDLLFGKIRPYFHKVAYMDKMGVSSSDAIVIRARRIQNIAYVLGLVSSDAFVAHAVTTSNGTKMPRADWKVLREHPLIEPPEDLLDRYCRLVTAGLKNTANLADQNTRLRAARDLLLPKLISGEIEVGQADEVFAEAAE